MFSIIYEKQRGGYAVKYKDQNGKPKRPLLMKCDKQDTPPPEVVRLAEQYRPQVSTSKSAPSASSLSAYCDRYLRHRAHDLKPRSLVMVRIVIKHFLAFAAQNRVTTIQGVSAALMNDYILECLTTRTKTTVRTYVNYLSGMFALAVDEDVIHLNLCRKLRKKLKEKCQPKPKYHTPEQVARLVKAIDQAVRDNFIKSQFRDAFLVMLGTGMRREAAVNIGVSWVDGDQLTVPKKSLEDGRDYTKTGVPYTLTMLEPAKSVIQRRVKELGSGRIFPDVHREGQSVYRAIRLVIETPKYGCSDMIVTGHFCHALRHTHATILYGQGTELQVIGHQLGHASLRTTEAYAKLTNEAQSELIRSHSIT